MEKTQIFGMDVVVDPTLPSGTFKLVSPGAYDDVYVSQRGMAFVKKMTRAEFDRLAMKMMSPQTAST